MLSESLTWRDEWTSPFEGALTRLWKTVLFNSLTPTELSHAVFQKNMVSSAALKRHGRSLLCTDWMRPAQGRNKRIAVSAYQSGLDRYSERWATAIASDQHLRFCRTCLVQGYQSIFHQIDALTHCLIHGDSILDRCTRCGAPTPRYALTKDVLSSPYRCPHCQEYLCLTTPTTASFGFLQASDNERLIAGASRYQAIARWLCDLNDFDIYWPAMDNWQPKPEWGVMTKNYRKMLFFALASVTPINVEMISRELPRYTAVIYQADTPPRSALSVPLNEGERAQRVALYLRLRDSIKNHFLRRHQACVRRAQETLRIEWASDIMWPTAQICPFAFGFFLWRHLFECVNIFHADVASLGVELRPAALVWPEGRVVPLAVWGEFALRSFYANLQVAMEWQCKAPRQIPYRQPWSSDLLELIESVRIELSPRFWGTSPRVTYLETKHRGADEPIRLIVLGPSSTSSRISPDVTAFRFENEPGVRYEREYRSA